MMPGGDGQLPSTGPMPDQGDTEDDLGMSDANMDGMDDQTGAAMPNEPEGGEEGGDSTIDIINQLSPTDREAVRAYAESMLARDETNGEDEMGAGVPAQAAPQDQGVMMEITKGRLMDVQRRLNEAFGDMVANSDKDETDRKQKKVKTNKKGFRSPFDSPFN